MDAARMRGQNRPRCTTGQHRPTLRTLDRSGPLDPRTEAPGYPTNLPRTSSLPPSVESGSLRQRLSEDLARGADTQ
jgi:hypothetical protein